jgi:hypothetical protein
MCMVWPKKKMCVYCHMSKKSMVGRDYYFFFLDKTGNSRSRYFIFEISGKSSFIEANLWRIMQFFYLLCSQFRQKASSWINKTLLLVKQQKWLSEFCVKIHRVSRVTVNTFFFFLALPYPPLFSAKGNYIKISDKSVNYNLSYRTENDSVYSTITRD